MFSFVIVMIIYKKHIECGVFVENRCFYLLYESGILLFEDLLVVCAIPTSLTSHPVISFYEAWDESLIYLKSRQQQKSLAFWHASMIFSIYCKSQREVEDEK